MQGGGLLIGADHRLFGVVQFLGDGHHIVHFGRIVFMQFRNGRGRDAGQLPLAPIPTSATAA